MRRSLRKHLVALITLILFCACGAFADPILDPQIIISDPTTCTGPNCNVTDNNFTFGIDGNTTLMFQNNSGNNWGALLLTWIPGEPISAISVVFGTGFSGWTSFKFSDAADLASNFGLVNPDPNLVGLYLLCVNQPTCDIHSGSTFTFDFAPDGGNWVGTDFDGEGRDTVPVPEPGLLVLLFSTIMFFAASKRLCKSLTPNFSLNIR